jgi:hypothetical protein
MVVQPKMTRLEIPILRHPTVETNKKIAQLIGAGEMGTIRQLLKRVEEAVSPI